MAAALERFLVVWCADLAVEGDSGDEMRAFADVVTAVSDRSPRLDAVRPGMCAVPTRGPSRYFGGDGALAALLRMTVRDALAAHHLFNGAVVGIGVADGLFAAALAARHDAAREPGRGQDGDVSRRIVSRMSRIGQRNRIGRVDDRAALLVPPGATPGFLAPWPVAVLRRPEIADVLGRLGIATLGAFAALPATSVLSRFGADAAACHAVASGRSSELPGMRAAVARPGVAAPTTRQPGFWGGAAGADERAAAALSRVQQLLGPHAVVVGRLQGGRGPAERARVVPFGPATIADVPPPGALSSAAPWPGQLPPPAPAVVLADPVPAVLDGDGGDPVGVSANGLLTGTPRRISVCGGAWAAVAGWAGPWPADEKWWTPAHTRRARMQVVVAGGAACLLVRQRGGWWLEGLYD